MVVRQSVSYAHFYYAGSWGFSRLELNLNSRNASTKSLSSILCRNDHFLDCIQVSCLSNDAFVYGIVDEVVSKGFEARDAPPDGKFGTR